MPTPAAKRGMKISRLITNVVASFVGAAGILVLATWAFLLNDSGDAKSNWIAKTNPTVAIILIMLAAGFKMKSSRKVTALDGFANILALVAVALSGVKLAGQIGGHPFPVDQFLFSQRFTSESAYNGNLMTSYTAFSCLISALVLLLLASY